MPPFTVVGPVCVRLVPDKVNVPVPTLINPTLLYVSPANVAEVFNPPMLQFTSRPSLPVPPERSLPGAPESSPMEMVGVPLETRFCRLVLSASWMRAFGQPAELLMRKFPPSLSVMTLSWPVKVDQFPLKSVRTYGV